MRAPSLTDTIARRKITLGPQFGPQTAFATTKADIAIFGGAAGSGKTDALLREPLRWVNKVPGFDAVIFRRTTPQITNPGGVWDQGSTIYRLADGIPHLGPPRRFTWPGAGTVRFAHLQYEDTVYDWDGSQITCLLFDELTGSRTKDGVDHGFSFFQFWYLVSRNRSTCGIKPYIRATCNPNADHWVADFLAWWIDQDTGFPIPERSGVIRYVVRGHADKLVWADNPNDLRHYLPTVDELPPGVIPPEPKSVTFIPATIYDNPTLLRINPDYLANLQALPEVERERLLKGNWKIRPAAGLYFRREWCEMIDTPPAGLTTVRYWDLAGTEKTQANDPDWTVGVKLGKDFRDMLYILDVIRERVGPYEVEQLLQNTAITDGYQTTVGFGRDPGQAGKWQAAYLVRGLMGFTVLPEPETGKKDTRFGPFSSQCRAGNVKILKGPWNEPFFRALEGFPETVHDDDIDACSGALELLTTNAVDFGMWARLGGLNPEDMERPT
jgi:predicted phage terminase large subunit-like protein